ncbi:NAD-dependent epimerase/dehydratase family protein [Fulvivirgaceae bacterium BMA10]|uniref:NAD-dependent epimerase/dehydratase family protein n=1 Tax=Splendidivirga corallicola TaxID=3051826 RepID=A0ABT8KRT5_9BACT|nr:NAD-dependent epimerase/dehydratase family protein [Fulvivirgaceae bacterium BMA10]
MSKVLVTGNAGFIGMHTFNRLVNEGLQVIGLDNINEYYDINLKYGRLKEQGFNPGEISYGNLLSSDTGNAFIKLNLEDKESILKLFSDQKFDYVVHLAAQAGVRYSLKSPDTYIESNIKGFLNVLEACRKFKVKHLIYASSSSVYGLNSKIPFKESHPTEHPVSLYAATKKADELMAHSYSYLYDLPVTGLRFFTVYGPWGRPDMALFKFTKNILEDSPIDVYNNGDMRRDFTYIDDIVTGIYHVIEKIPSGSSKQETDATDLASDQSTAPFALYNIGNSNPVKLMDFIRALEDSLGKKAKINFMPLQPGDVVSTYADVENLNQSIGYVPEVDVEKGITEFVKWYQKYYRV